MNLRPNERDYYVLEITTEPALAGTWEASFDGGATWVAGVEGGGRWSWLIAGPDFDAAAVGLDPADTAAVVDRSMTPELRNVDAPVLDAEVGEPIVLVP